MSDIGCQASEEDIALCLGVCLESLLAASALSSDQHLGGILSQAGPGQNSANTSIPAGNGTVYFSCYFVFMLTLGLIPLPSQLWGKTKKFKCEEQIVVKQFSALTALSTFEINQLMLRRMF